jgi:hypothetical protein
MIRLAALRTWFALVWISAGCAFGAPAPRSAENQVFQWHVSAENTGWPDGTKNKATLYLWIPEKTERVRGVVVMATNVPEHGLVGHPSIRRACAENDLALVWGVPSFWRFGKAAPAPGAEPVDVKTLPDSDSIQAAFLERLLTALAERSGYAELATAPLLPVGESGHLLMVVGLINARPERVIAGVCVKNPHLPKNKTVPLLWTLGTGQEWGQTERDVRETHVSDAAGYAGWGRDRAAADWPLSAAVEAGTGHFYCSDAMADYFGRYIASACRARLSADGSSAFRPIDLAAGFLAQLPLPGQTDLAVYPYSESPDKARPWFFDADLAREAQALTSANWDAAPQFAIFAPSAGVTVEPFALNSVTKLSVRTDGEFTVRAELASAIPEGFVGAGAPLTRAPGAPLVEWVCGPFATVDAASGRFRVSLDRAWKNGGAAYLIARHEGDAGIRRTVQPAYVTLVENKDGDAQSITFPPFDDVPVGTVSVPLAATADSGLPVSYFVVSGPAVIRGDRLVLTPLPPRASFPVEVTVAAWQWGRASEPQVKTAEIVRKTFHITRLASPPPPAVHAGAP